MKVPTLILNIYLRLTHVCHNCVWQVASCQPVQEEEEEECALRNDVALSSSPPMSPPASPLDSMVIEKSPPSASIHAISPSTRFASKALDRWREGGARRRLKKEKEKEKEEQLRYKKAQPQPRGVEKPIRNFSKLVETYKTFKT